MPATPPPDAAAPAAQAPARPPAATLEEADARGPGAGAAAEQKRASPGRGAPPMPSPHPAPLSRVVAAGELLAIEPPDRSDADGNPIFAMEFLFLRWNPWAHANEVLVFRGWNAAGSLDLLCVPTVAGPWSDLADTMQSVLPPWKRGRAVDCVPTTWSPRACLPQPPRTGPASQQPGCPLRPEWSSFARQPSPCSCWHPPWACPAPTTPSSRCGRLAIRGV